MLSWFERLIDPYKDVPIVQPPDKLGAYYRHYIRPVWWVYALIMLFGLLGSLIEVSLVRVRRPNRGLGQVRREPRRVLRVAWPDAALDGVCRDGGPALGLRRSHDAPQPDRQRQCDEHGALAAAPLHPAAEPVVLPERLRGPDREQDHAVRRRAAADAWPRPWMRFGTSRSIGQAPR